MTLKRTEEAYIIDTASFLPGLPVGNEDIESVLGMLGDVPSRVRKIILRNNRITRRYYAIDPATGKATHNNARLTAEAVKALAPYDGFNVGDIDCLCCGTSSPDQLMPGHGIMVHGELGGNPCEVMTTSGICVSGVVALKHATMNVLTGYSKLAVATGSEVASSFMRSSFFATENNTDAAALKAKPSLAFESDFLRWMLSDGAGAALVSGSPSDSRLSLKVDWIEILSYAGEFDTCMYAGAHKNEDGTLTGWRERGSIAEEAIGNAFAVKQDVKLLNELVSKVTVNRALSSIMEKHSLRPGDIDWFLPHYSSHFFREEVYRRLEEIDFAIPYERWFTNLYDKGNTGSAAFFIMLDELFHSGKVEKGQRLLCFVPESGRFSAAYILLTAV